MSKSQSEFPSPKKLCRALHSVLQNALTFSTDRVFALSKKAMNVSFNSPQKPFVLYLVHVALHVQNLVDVFAVSFPNETALQTPGPRHTASCPSTTSAASTRWCTPRGRRCSAASSPPSTGS